MLRDTQEWNGIIPEAREWRRDVYVHVKTIIDPETGEILVEPGDREI